MADQLVGHWYLTLSGLDAEVREFLLLLFVIIIINVIWAQSLWFQQVL